MLLAAAPAAARAATLLRAETVPEVAPASPPAALEEEEEERLLPRSTRSGAAYLALGNNVPQQLGPTRAADLERELHDDFEFVAPLVGPLDKKALIAATTGLDLGEGLPDFDARYHDFRLDADDPSRVWCMMRVVGTHTGPLRFGSLDAAPKDPPRRAESPPEAVSLRFADDGRLIELTTGYVVDRRVGTTGGLGGLFGVLEGIGYSLPAPLTRTTGELPRRASRARRDPARGPGARCAFRRACRGCRTRARSSSRARCTRPTLASPTRRCSPRTSRSPVRSSARSRSASSSRRSAASSSPKRCPI